MIPSTITTRSVAAPRRSGKRGNNEGSITQLADGRWQARVTLEAGKRKAFYGKTRVEAAAKLNAALRDRDRGLPVGMDERQTTGQYLQTWLESTRGQIEPSSWRRYGDYVRVHLAPGLGKVALAKLSAQQVQAFYGRKQEEGLSGTTVHCIHGMLHRALEDALRMGLVQRNVTETVRAPRRSTKEMHSLTEEQAQRFLAAAADAANKGDRFYALYVLALTTGMREGELLGLRWSDIDFGGKKLQIRMAVQEAAKGFILAEPKTDYSRRTIGLSPTPLEALHAHRAKQNEERLALGEAWSGTLDLVFPNVIGGLMIPDNLAKRGFKKLLRRAGLDEGTHFHCLRHTAATILISRGLSPKLVSQMLGHSDISITLRVYAHVTPHEQQAAMDIMEQIFGKRGARLGGYLGGS
jgi:integrase